MKRLGEMEQLCPLVKNFTCTNMPFLLYRKRAKKSVLASGREREKEGRGVLKRERERLRERGRHYLPSKEGWSTPASKCPLPCPLAKVVHCPGILSIRLALLSLGKTERGCEEKAESFHLGVTFNICIFIIKG